MSCRSAYREVSREQETETEIQYTDLSDIVKMLNLKTGGAMQDPVNEAQRLVTYPHERQ